MNIFKILSCLYTTRDLQWLQEVEENDTSPFLVQRWLCHDDRIAVQTRWLDKYVFDLTLHQYLSLAWSIIPKSSKAPYIKYISINKDEEEFSFLFKRIRKHFELSDNDFRAVKQDLIRDIAKNKVDWFKFYGIEKKYWTQHHLNFDEMGTAKKEKYKGLDTYDK